MALSATELRIGNLFYYHIVDEMDERGEWDEISQIDYDDLRILTEFKDNSEYKPIPLSEEWLLKFGFTKPAHSFIGDIFHLSEWDEFKNTWCVVMNKNNAVVVSKLKYVHQLQNLYFALTGTELPIDLKSLNQK